MPALEALTETLNKLKRQSSRYPVEEFGDLLANLDITPGESTKEASIQAAKVWARVEDQDDVVEAMREDAVEEMAAQLAETSMNGRDASEGEGAGGDENTEHGGVPHRPTLNFRTLASWRGQRRRAAMEKPYFT